MRTLASHREPTRRAYNHADNSPSSTSADLLNAHVRSNAYGTIWTAFFTGLGGGP